MAGCQVRRPVIGWSTAVPEWRARGRNWTRTPIGNLLPGLLARIGATANSRTRAELKKNSAVFGKVSLLGRAESGIGQFLFGGHISWNDRPLNMRLPSADPNVRSRYGSIAPATAQIRGDNFNDSTRQSTAGQSISRQIVID